MRDYMEDCSGRRMENAGFISTRLAGMDGVSLESEKWAEIFTAEGLTCFFMAGELDTPAARSYEVAEAHFRHPEIREIQRACFGVSRREPATTRKIHKIKSL